MNVKVTARQWSWLFTYDNGKKSTDLVVPQGRDVALTMESLDVIHGFFIPAYRIKQDVVPTMNNARVVQGRRTWERRTSCARSTAGSSTPRCSPRSSSSRPGRLRQVGQGEDVDIPGLDN